MKKLTIVLSLLLVSFQQQVFAAVYESANVPDSVYLFSYTTTQDDGRSGLRFAWSADKEQWFEIGKGCGYHVQKLYGQNAGDLYIPSQIKLDNVDERVKIRLASSIVRDTKTGDVIVKLVNYLPNLLLHEQCWQERPIAPLFL